MKSVYHPIRATMNQVLFTLVSRRQPGTIWAALLMGPPGCGKTRAASELARALDAPLVYHMMHEWTDADELFVGVNVRAAVAGHADEVEEPGVLLHAARLSHEGRVVLCLDEVDKAQPHAENLLLDFLQHGRVPVSAGHHVQADVDNMFVVLTTNMQRTHGDALLRRCRRVRFAPMSAQTMSELLVKELGITTGLAVTWVAACFAVSAHEGQATGEAPVVSYYEVREGLKDAMALADAMGNEAQAARAALAMWALRHEDGHDEFIARLNIGSLVAAMKEVRQREA